MGPCNVLLTRHLEQVRLRAEYLRQQRLRPAACPAPAVVAEPGMSVAELVVRVRLARLAAALGDGVN